MIGVCTKLTRALACSAASGDEPGAGRRDCICSSLSFEAYCDPCFSSASYLNFNTQSVKELGYDQPTDDQAEVLQKFVSGRDAFISLPTGSGKSQTLCFTCVSTISHLFSGFFNWNSALCT